MKKLIQLAALTILAASFSACTPAQGMPSEVTDHGDAQQRQAIWSDVRESLFELNFDRADAMASKFRDSGEKTPSGLSKLGEFHAGAQGLFDTPTRYNSCDIRDDGLMDKWIAHSPDEAAPYITKASYLISRAWCFRGHGTAAQVDGDAWKQFFENIKAAEDLLSAKKDVASRDPEYYVVLVDVYLAQGRSERTFRALLDEASGRFPDYHRLYWSALTYYKPQWFGSAAKIDTLARYAAERSRDTEGLGAYARFYWSASASACNCWREAIDWPTMKRGMLDVAARYPDSWNIANFAKLSCMMNDGETAHEYFVALGSSDGSVAWSNDQEGFARCRSLAGL